MVRIIQHFVPAGPGSRDRGDPGTALREEYLRGEYLREVTMEEDDWSGREDLNLRPLPPQGSALPVCATARHGPYVIGCAEKYQIETRYFDTFSGFH